MSSEGKMFLYALVMAALTGIIGYDVGSEIARGRAYSDICQRDNGQLRGELCVQGDSVLWETEADDE